MPQEPGTQPWRMLSLRRWKSKIIMSQWRKPELTQYHRSQMKDRRFKNEALISRKVRLHTKGKRKGNFWLATLWKAEVRDSWKTWLSSSLFLPGLCEGHLHDKCHTPMWWITFSSELAHVTPKWHECKSFFNLDRCSSVFANRMGILF